MVAEFCSLWLILWGNPWNFREVLGTLSSCGRTKLFWTSRRTDAQICTQQTKVRVLHSSRTVMMSLGCVNKWHKWLVCIYSACVPPI